MTEYRRHLPPDASLPSLHVALNRLWEALEAQGGVTASAQPTRPLGASPSIVVSGAAPASTVTRHNALTGLQGGDVDNYYHLKNDEYIGTGTGVFVRKDSPTITGSITLGTVIAGLWNGTKIGLAYGGTNADLSATGGASQVLRQSTLGGAVSVSQLAFSDVSSTCAPTQGGTGMTAYALGDMLYASATNTLSALAGYAAAAMAVLTMTGTGAAAAAPVWTGTSGTGNIARVNTPTMVTPILGVATATSINKVAITAPATSATLTIADGKTLTTSNTLTFAGTDGSTLNIGTGGTLGTGAFASAYVLPTATSTVLGGVKPDGTTLTNTSGALSVTYGTTSSTAYRGDNPSGFTTNLGTVTSVAALTLGTTGTDLSSTVATGTTTPVITLNVPTASATNRGALSAADWTTFNGKQAALGFTPINKAGDTGIGNLSMGALTATGAIVNTGYARFSTSDRGFSIGPDPGMPRVYFGDIAGTFSFVSGSGAAAPVSMGALTATTTRSTAYTAATLPTGALGMRAFITDGTSTSFGSITLGGGSAVIPVYYDGSNWRVG